MSTGDSRLWAVVWVFIGIVIGYFLRRPAEVPGARREERFWPPKAAKDLYGMSQPYSPPSTPVLDLTCPGRPDSMEWEFAVVSDLDHASLRARETNGSLGASSWHAVLRRGRLVQYGTHFRVFWTSNTTLSALTGTKGRGMELSELVWYRNRLLAFCDITGLVWEVLVDTELHRGDVFQRHAIADGDGHQAKPFKSEWATVKDGLVYVGSVGKPYWDEETGEMVHRNSEFIKTIDPSGKIQNIDWGHVYQKLRDAANVTGQGYLWHEAVDWDCSNRRWLILPRKRSLRGAWSTGRDETMGTNVLLIADEGFEAVEARFVGPLEPEFGFSSLRHVPGVPDVFVALKAFEVEGDTHSKLGVFDVSGAPRLADGDWVELGPEKYEGLTFIA